MIGAAGVLASLAVYVGGAAVGWRLGGWLHERIHGRGPW